MASLSECRSQKSIASTGKHHRELRSEQCPTFLVSTLRVVGDEEEEHLEKVNKSIIVKLRVYFGLGSLKNIRLHPKDEDSFHKTLVRPIGTPEMKASL